MKKIKGSALFALLAVASGALASCGKKGASGEVEFWSAFGATYGNALESIVSIVQEDTGVSIKHASQGGYDTIATNMGLAISAGKYPHIAQGYPDHFANYLGADVLTPLDDYIADWKDDYIEDYMKENHFIDAYGEDKIYGVPFNKSTELLGYNGTFVNYCATINPELAVLPQTWDEWAGAKGQQYRKIYDDLIDGALCIYGKQDVKGEASELVACKKNAAESSGKDLLIDFSNVVKNKTRLLTWDATDNAFITLIKQWDAEYTKLPADQLEEHPFLRVGDVLFGNKQNMPKVVECMKFFRKLAEKRIFGVPTDLNSTYSSEAFETGQVMFMVCSSGGLSYNTGTWKNRFKVAPIPYKDEQHKIVISQGANICMTDKGNFEESAKVIKGLTTGRGQIDWCLKTGYYPCSKSAVNSEEYQNFLTEAVENDPTKGIEKYIADNKVSKEDALAEVYKSPSRVAFREGSIVNNDYYMNTNEGWTKFVDDAFMHSSKVRTVVKDVFKIIFKDITSDQLDNDSAYKNVLIKKILQDENIADDSNINIIIDN